MTRSTTPRATSGRRGFLRQLGATAAAALGVAALPRGASAATGTATGVPPEDCTVYCYVVSAPCAQDPGGTLFRCVSRCGGEQTVCYRRTTANFCLSQQPC